jgi:hypothetical protein
MRFLVVFYIIISVLFSCDSESQERKTVNELENNTDSDSSNKTQSQDKSNVDFAFSDYFYPIEDEPYIYAFIDKYNPISERFFRYVSMEKDGEDFFVIELYNETLRIFEGFTLDPNNGYKVVDHMKVDRGGIKRSSGLTKKEYFPSDINDQSVFIADFPSHLDSVIMIYESRKNVIDIDIEIEVLGEKMKAIKLVDTVRVHMVNTYTKATSTQEAPIYRYYAKGLGQVRFEGVDSEVQYNLNKILPDSWWMEYAR